MSNSVRSKMRPIERPLICLHFLSFFRKKFSVVVSHRRLSRRLYSQSEASEKGSESKVTNARGAHRSGGGAGE